MLIIHGELIKGSALYEILKNNGLSIIDTGAEVNANHIKQARYYLQVSVYAIYSKLKEIKEKKQSVLMPFVWLETKSD